MKYRIGFYLGMGFEIDVEDVEGLNFKTIHREICKCYREQFPFK